MRRAMSPCILSEEADDKAQHLPYKWIIINSTVTTAYTVTSVAETAPSQESQTSESPSLLVLLVDGITLC